MWIALLISVRMMNPVCGGPLNRPALDGKRSAEHEKVFNWLWDLVTSMSDQSMIAHPNSQAACDPVKNHGANNCRPTPEKNCRHYCGNVRDDEKNAISPFDVSFAICLDHCCPSSFHFKLSLTLSVARI
jgi:hypothetical protein